MTEPLLSLLLMPLCISPPECDPSVLPLTLYKSSCQGFGLISNIFSGTMEDLQSQSTAFRSKAGMSQATECGASERMRSWTPTALFNGTGGHIQALCYTGFPISSPSERARLKSRARC